MLSIFRLARTVSVRTGYHNSGAAVWVVVQKPAMSTTRKVGLHSNVAKASTVVNRKSNTVVSAAAESKPLDVRSPLRSNKRFPWTDEKDAALLEGIAKYKADGWPKVAEFVGGGVTYQQCKYRASYLEGLAQKGINDGAWDPEEMSRLEELVPQYLVHSYWSTRYKKMTDEYTDWEGVGKELGRLPIDCCRKWRSLEYEQMKKGRFTAEEDVLIRQRVAEWGDKGSGLWVALRKEMGRAAELIKQRWNILISEFQHADTVIYWTDETDERLKEGVAQHKAESWAKVAKYVGGGVCAEQCKNRWYTYHSAMQHGNVKRGAWEPDEVERLAVLVPQHLVPSYLSKNTGRMTKEYTDWVKVGAKLGRLPLDCKVKWTALRTATMKKGPFTDSENAIIRERVEGWGDNKTRGLWVGLEKDLGRSADTVRKQWVNVLSKE